MNRNYDWTYDFSFNELYVHFNGKHEGEKKYILLKNLFEQLILLFAIVFFFESTNKRLLFSLTFQNKRVAS